MTKFKFMKIKKTVFIILFLCLNNTVINSMFISQNWPNESNSKNFITILVNNFYKKILDIIETKNEKNYFKIESEDNFKFYNGANVKIESEFYLEQLKDGKLFVKIIPKISMYNYKQNYNDNDNDKECIFTFSSNADSLFDNINSFLRLFIIDNLKKKISNFIKTFD